MKATSLLKKQHQKVRAMFKKLDDGRGDMRMVHELANELAAHLAIEQKLFYPAMRALDEELILESYEEHALAETAMKRLLAVDPQDPSFHARVMATKELVEHHMEEEEEELFPQVEKHFDERLLERLGTEMEVMFDQVVAQGFEAAVPQSMAVTSADNDRKRLSGSRVAL